MGLTYFRACLALALIFTNVGPGFAEGPKPFPVFEAKRVKPPSARAGNRIDVQIQPGDGYDDQSDSAATQEGAQPGSGSGPKEPRGARYAWFWSDVSTKRGDSGPGRLAPALVALKNGPSSVASPRLQTLQDIAAAQGREILLSTVGTSVSPALALAVIAVESAGRVDAVSTAGAQGLMQLMPATADRFGVEDPFVAGQNIRGGVAYLNLLMQEFDRDPILVLSAYNAGEGAVRKYEGVPPFPETRDYVPKVLAAFDTARGLCRTPPELVSDGCVFNVMH